MSPFKKTVLAPASVTLELVSVPDKGKVMKNDTLKLIAATLLFLLWAAVLVGKHFWPDLQIEGIQQAIGSALLGLGIYHVAKASPTNTDD